MDHTEIRNILRNDNFTNKYDIRIKEKKCIKNLFNTKDKQVVVVIFPTVAQWWHAVFYIKCNDETVFFDCDGGDPETYNLPKVDVNFGMVLQESGDKLCSIAGLVFVS